MKNMVFKHVPGRINQNMTQTLRFQGDGVIMLKTFHLPKDPKTGRLLGRRQLLGRCRLAAACTQDRTGVTVYEMDLVNMLYSYKCVPGTNSACDFIAA